MTTSLRLPLASRLFAPLAFVALTGSALGQCALVAESGGRVPDADGAVYASCAWDPDGNGPAPAQIALGGAFSVLGNAASPGFALYDPVSRDCTSLGSGIAGAYTFHGPRVSAIATLPNNHLVVVGDFLTMNGLASPNVVRWNGSQWQTMAGGLPFGAWAVTVLPNGDLVAGGHSGPRVLRWNGTAWMPMGAGLSGHVYSLATLPNGDVVAGGFELLGAGAHLARWDGVAWSAFPGNFGAAVHALLTLPNGDLIAAGAFITATGAPANGIARWDGSAWSQLGSGSPIPVFSVTRLPNGDLLAGGSFTSAGGVPARGVARWDGVSWSAIGGGPGSGSPAGASVLTVFPLPNGDLIAGGSFTSPGRSADNVARWDGTAWTPIRSGTGGTVFTSAVVANGDLIVGGDFTMVEGVAANRVARRGAGGVWQPLGAGVDGAVRAVLPLPNGDIVVGGDFESAGGVPATRVARWDGAAWHALGAGLPASVRSFARDSSGRILAAGSFLDRYAVWDGQAWHGTGVATAFMIGSPSLVTLPDGDILAPISSTPIGPIARWTGVGWESLTGLPSSGGVASGTVAVLPNGHVLMTYGQWVRRWSGSGWTTVGSHFASSVSALAVLPNGDVIVGGAFTTNGSTPMPRLARWNGTAWTPVGDGASAEVEHLRWSDDGRLFVGGAFSALLGESTGAFGEIGSTCLGTAVSAGAGCSGSGGPNVLAAVSLPWVGGNYASVATGMPAAGIAVEVLGFSAVSIPLATLLPQAGANCVLSTAPDVLQFGVPESGALEPSLLLPNTPALVGATFRQQVVAFELDAGGAIVTATATNSLQLTIGRF